MFRSTFSLWLLALLSVANAQIQPHRNYVFNGDSRVIADIAVWCVTDLANIIISLFCVLPILRLKEHRATYITLCAASFFTVFQASVNIGQLFFSNNGADIPSVDKQAGLLSTVQFFGVWSSVLLYLTLVILLYDRVKSISRGALHPVDRDLFVFAFAYAAILFIVATVNAGLVTRSYSLQARFFNTGPIATTPAEALAVVAAEGRTQNSSFAFSSFWFFSTVVITALSISTFVRAKRSGLHDKINRSILLFVVPLYYAAMIAGIVFTIFSSPSVVIVSIIESQNLALANDIITQFLYTAVMAVILVLGFKTDSWRVRDHSVALSTLGAVPSGGYVELDDPQK